MKTIDAIIIHCSATRAGQDLRAKDIDRMHRARGFNQIGYNFVIDLDGTVENGRRCLLTGHIVIRKGSLACLTINTVSVFVISAGWIPAVSRRIPELQNKKPHFVIWWLNSVKSTLLLNYSVIEIHHPI